MQRACLIAVCLVCLPCASGCVIPYAFPKLDYTQALKLDAPHEEVRVFRVDIERGKVICTVAERECLAELRMTQSGTVWPQLKPSMPAGVYLFMVALNYDFRLSKSLALRAYRPGYELI